MLICQHNKNVFSYHTSLAEVGGLHNSDKERILVSSSEVGQLRHLLQQNVTLLGML